MLTVTQQIWTANLLLLLHAVAVGITVGGFVAMLTGRFARFHRRDYFAWAFIICCGGQILSLVLTGGCVFTQWERVLRQQFSLWPTDASRGSYDPAKLAAKDHCGVVRPSQGSKAGPDRELLVLRQQADPQATFVHTFLQEYPPFLPAWLVNAVPIIALGGLCGASIQIYPALRRKRQEREKSIH